MKRRISLLLVFVIVLGLFGLPSNHLITSAKKSVMLNKKSITLFVGRSKKLYLKNSKGKVTWKSSKKSVADVTSKGLVKAKKAGRATIIALNNNKMFTCNVTVKNKTIPVPSPTPTRTPLPTIAPTIAPIPTATGKPIETLVPSLTPTPSPDQNISPTQPISFSENSKLIVNRKKLFDRIMSENNSDYKGKYVFTKYWYTGGANGGSGKATIHARYKDNAPILEFGIYQGSVPSVNILYADVSFILYVDNSVSDIDACSILCSMDHLVKATKTINPSYISQYRHMEEWKEDGYNISGYYTKAANTCLGIAYTQCKKLAEQYDTNLDDLLKE